MATKTGTAISTDTERSTLLAEQIARQHCKFIASDPKGTLKALRDRLRLAVEQCERLVEM